MHAYTTQHTSYDHIERTQGLQQEAGEGIVENPRTLRPETVSYKYKLTAGSGDQTTNLWITRWPLYNYAMEDSLFRYVIQAIVIE